MLTQMQNLTNDEIIALMNGIEHTDHKFFGEKFNYDITLCEERTDIAMVVVKSDLGEISPTNQVIYGVIKNELGELKLFDHFKCQNIKVNHVYIENNTSCIDGELNWYETEGPYLVPKTSKGVRKINLKSLIDGSNK